MKLVLVSQDKENSTIYNSMSICKWYDENYIVQGYNVFGDIFTLGYYSSKKKAKKVMKDIINLLEKERYKVITNGKELSQEELLEIDKKICNHENIVLPNGTTLEKIERDYIVFEFPQDEEVDVE